jgi:hypothetical protein
MARQFWKKSLRAPQMEFFTGFKGILYSFVSAKEDESVDMNWGTLVWRSGGYGQRTQ